MARFKDFGSPFDSDSAEKLSFKIYDEEFFCYPEMPGKTLLEFVSLSNSEDPAETAKSINTFFKKVLTEESYVQFENLAQDPNRVVSVTTLTEIIQWLVEEYSGRPTQGPEHSPTGA